MHIITVDNEKNIEELNYVLDNIETALQLSIIQDKNKNRACDLKENV
jgi:hypothetical protein